MVQRCYPKRKFFESHCQNSLVSCHPIDRSGQTFPLDIVDRLFAASSSKCLSECKHGLQKRVSKKRRRKAASSVCRVPCLSRSRHATSWWLHQYHCVSRGLRSANTGHRDRRDTYRIGLDRVEFSRGRTLVLAANAVILKDGCGVFIVPRCGNRVVAFSFRWDNRDSRYGLTIYLPVTVL